MIPQPSFPVISAPPPSNDLDVVLLGTELETKTKEVPLQRESCKESCSPSLNYNGLRNPELLLTKPPQNLTGARALEEKDEVQMEGPL